MRFYLILTKTVNRRGKVVPIEDIKPNSSAKVQVLCPSCGKTRMVHYRSIIKAGHCVCQSCVMHRYRKIIPAGTRFGLLEVILESESNGFSVCLCDCGNVKQISNSNLYAGQRSCGCIKKNNFTSVIRVSGERHGMWKGGISRERQRIMQSQKYKTWRTSVFKRDDYTCIICKQKGYNLNAHHVVPFSSDNSLRFDIDNGITMCKECHSVFHHIFGRQNIGQQEINTFIIGDSRWSATQNT